MAEEERRRFANLRSVRWRVHLGILPASPEASVDELRRATADSRRRYVSLRRRLMVDPHLPKEEDRSSNLVVDNPLSQNPDSSWGRFFRGAELEKTVDQDLSRLYPEDGSYFQTPNCQAMLRRILLMWCLQHPECGYRQGMHELLAPLVYVLQVDIDKLSQVRKLHEDCFNDDFDGVCFPDTDMVFSYKPRKDSKWHSRNDSERASKVNSLDELDMDTKEIILLSDAYGAEGELGVVLSERFMEHDAYSIFDGLMDGGSGVVRMAEFFSISKVGSSSSLPPVIEASSSLFHLLSIVEPSLHSHFVELDVEPQYFALRWLRVLFGREFCLNDLLIVWDEVFACSNDMLLRENEEYSFKILCSSRGAFIAAMAVSMILHLRSSLLATEINTSCLQRLLNFPNNVDVHKLIEKAKSLQSVAIDANKPSPSFLSKKDSYDYDRAYSNLATSTPPRTPLHPLSESYWEEQWRNLHKDGSTPKEIEKVHSYKRSLKESLSQRLGLSRTESDPSPVKVASVKSDTKNSVRRRLLGSFDEVVRSSEVAGKFEQDEFPISIRREPLGQLKLKTASEENFTVSPSVARTNPLLGSPVEPAVESSTKGTEICSSGENSPVFYAASAGNELDNCQDNDSERSSITSNSCAGDNDRDEVLQDESSSSICENKTVSEAVSSEKVSEAVTSEKDIDPVGPSERTAVSNERKPFINKLQWFLRFGRPSGEGNVEKGTGEASDDKHGAVPPSAPPSDVSTDSSYGGTNLASGDKKVMGTLKNIGQNMLENIQVIESAFQQDRGQPSAMENFSNNILGGKGQVTAMAALTELRKISNLLREM
ncbi:unnamed protein product [Urochloa decumbens]|uniref:Rab-GAP TBC domain-containing protein n=1 Tax=Urochloa decumbens TaxID=240449 RepID=A0ABC9BDZ9_9POAL